jgi:hypothetical protein
MLVWRDEEYLVFASYPRGDPLPTPVIRHLNIIGRADTIIAYNLIRKKFMVRKCRHLDVYDHMTCFNLVTEVLKSNINLHGCWNNPADETIFLLKYGGIMKKTVVDI